MATSINPSAYLFRALAKPLQILEPLFPKSLMLLSQANRSLVLLKQPDMFCMMGDRKEHLSSESTKDQQETKKER